MRNDEGYKFSDSSSIFDEILVTAVFKNDVESMTVYLTRLTFML